MLACNASILLILNMKSYSQYTYITFNCFLFNKKILQMNFSKKICFKISAGITGNRIANDFHNMLTLPFIWIFHFKKFLYLLVYSRQNDREGDVGRKQDRKKDWVFPHICSLPKFLETDHPETNRQKILGDPQVIEPSSAVFSDTLAGS